MARKGAHRHLPLPPRDLPPLPAVPCVQVASMIPKDLVKTSDFKLRIEGEGPYTCTASINIEALDRLPPSAP